MDLHKIAKYLQKQTDPEGIKLFKALASELGYYIKTKDVMNKINKFLAHEKKLYNIVDVVKRQESLIVLNRDIKEYILAINTTMPNITKREKKEILHILDEILERVVSRVLGISIKASKKAKNPVTKP